MGNLQASLTIRTSIGATLGAINSRTGRMVTCAREYGLVQNWAKMRRRQFLLLHPGREQLFEELCSVRRVCEPIICGYRGRPKSQTGADPGPTCMGPPKPHQTGDNGRYNKIGHPALYLSDSEYGVVSEMPDESIYIQEYNIPTDELRIADFRSFESESFINGVMWHAEMAGRNGYPTKIFSQTVGELIGRRFDGFVVPGVRGKDGLNYTNIVILRRLELWTEWLRKGCSPREVCIAHKNGNSEYPL